MSGAADDENGEKGEAEEGVSGKMKAEEVVAQKGRDEPEQQHPREEDESRRVVSGEEKETSREDRTAI